MYVQVETVHSLLEDITFQMTQLSENEINKHLAGPSSCAICVCAATVELVPQMLNKSPRVHTPVSCYCVAVDALPSLLVQVQSRCSSTNKAARPQWLQTTRAKYLGDGPSQGQVTPNRAIKH